jgi:AraC-like DNA-binding protein
MQSSINGGTDNNMKKPTKSAARIVHADRFRTPLAAERDMGLWVDRIGRSREGNVKSDALRILGLHAAIAIERGQGCLASSGIGLVPAPRDAAILVFPEIPHRYQPWVEWQTRFVVWGGPEAERLAAIGILSRDRPVIPGGAPIVVAAWRRLHPLMSGEDRGAILERKNVLLEMALGLYRCGQMDRRHGAAFRAVERTLAWMRVEYRRDLPIQECAAVANLSVTHFRHLFKEHTGRSPKEFLVSLRMSAAKEMLLRGSPIKEVAEAVGYRDLFHFMRQFKLATGHTPGAFRNAR